MVVQRGSGVEAIASTLFSEGVIGDRFLFEAGARLTGRSQGDARGRIPFPFVGISMDGTIALLVSGETVKRRITIAEGLTTSEALGLIGAEDGSRRRPSRRYRRGLAAAGDVLFLARRQPDRAGPGECASRWRSALASLWEKRAPDLALETPEQALVLASIIERETGVAAERARVSAVFHNRLRRGMRLQSDPTVAYALTLGSAPLDRPLVKSDLRVDRPTTPIWCTGCRPRRSPIRAAPRSRPRCIPRPPTSSTSWPMAPAATPSRAPLPEHLRNVARWRRSSARGGRSRNDAAG